MSKLSQSGYQFTIKHWKSADSVQKCCIICNGLDMTFINQVNSHILCCEYDCDSLIANSLKFRNDMALKHTAIMTEMVSMSLNKGV